MGDDLSDYVIPMKWSQWVIQNARKMADSGVVILITGKVVHPTSEEIDYLRRNLAKYAFELFNIIVEVPKPVPGVVSVFLCPEMASIHPSVLEQVNICVRFKPTNAQWGVANRAYRASVSARDDKGTVISAKFNK